MASLMLPLLYKGAVIIISCFAGLSLCNAFNYDNPIRLASDDAFSIMDDHLSRSLIDSIYQFGDSLSDVGNFKWENPYTSFAQPPYGVTYFHMPTGRPSDGRLMVDYIAEYFRLPFIEPFLNKSGDFTQGANFAVIGATALDVSTLRSKGIVPSMTNHSLSVQVNWFKSHLASICSHPLACRAKLWRSAFIMGEIGGNDYNFAISVGKPPEFTYQMVPEVVQAISDAVEELISIGARLIIIPGNLLMGCMTVYLYAFKSNDPTFYDELNCIKPLNDFSKYHNDQLRQTIRMLRLRYPLVIIMYMDLEGSMRKFFQNPTKYGFDKDVVYQACCGIGDNDYNYNYTACGTQGVPVCKHPKKYVNWDGNHLTSHVYKLMVKQFFKNCGEMFGDYSSVF